MAEEVYADGYIKVPAKKWYHIADALTRRDELMGAILKVLGAINEKLVAVPPAPPVVPPVPPVVPPVPPVVPPAPPVIPPAPIELKPITDRLDLLAGQLNAINNSINAYLGRIRGLPVARAGRYTGTDTTWQTVVSWNVGHVWSRRYGMLREISMTSSVPAVTRFRLRIENDVNAVLFDELEIGAPLTLPFPDNRLSYDTWVYLDCRSTGPAIVVDGSITGSEWR